MNINVGGAIESVLMVLLMLVVSLAAMIWYIKERRHLTMPEQRKTLRQLTLWSLISSEAAGFFFLSLVWWQILFHTPSALHDAGFIVSGSLLILAVLSWFNSYRLHERLRRSRG